MKKEIKIEALARVNVFTLPKNYFENLLDTIERATFLKKNQPNAFSVPESYFETLAARIQKRIHTERISLDNLPKVNVFQVPENYFETFEIPHEKLNPKKKRFQISWGNRQVWSAAASVVVVASSAWFFVTNPSSKSDNSPLKDVSKQEIVNYLQNQDLNEDDFNGIVKINKAQSDSLTIQQLNLSKEDIVNHLKNENWEETI